MSAPSGSQPIESLDQLAAAFEAGEKPSEKWAIGTEHEKFGFLRDTFEPLPYEGPRSISVIFEELRRQFGWRAVIERDKVIALKKNGESITLEPGGQLELSGAPLRCLHDTCDEVHRHLAQIEKIAEPLDVGFIGLGFAPTWARADIPVMPKARYDIMRAYMPKKGTLGLDMMLRTATVQVNLDYSSESDMVKKFRTALALQPVATALFANSPFTEGKPNGFLSYRSHIWSDTDPDRTGLLPFVFEDGMGYERYRDYALDVPMYFAERDGRYADVSGESFRAFLEGKLTQLPGERATMKDWENHLSTIFPEVRLKTFLEMRGADGGPWKSLCALPAFWVGLLYCTDALEEASRIADSITAEERAALRSDTPKMGLKAPFRNGSVRDLAMQTLAVAREGLRERAKTFGLERDEVGFLSILEATAESGRTPAEELLEQYHGEWAGDLRLLFEEHAY